MKIGGRSRNFRCGLFGADAGYAVFYAYLERQLPHLGGQFSSDVERCLRRAIADVPRWSDRPYLSHGFVGAAWAVEHLGGGLEAGAEDANAEVDGALLELLAASPASHHCHDLWFGLSGIGLYALERMPKPSARRLLATVIVRLEELAENDVQGVSWNLAPEWQLGVLQLAERLHPLGVVHGSVGPLCVLAAAHRWNVEPLRARRLGERVLRWLWASRRSDGHFPDTRESPASSPFVLAFGEIGIAAGMFQAATALQLPTFRSRALRVLRSLARAEVSSTRAPDLLVGVAGAAHAFARLYRTTREPCFRTAARAWLRRLLELPRPGRGPAGYRFYIPPYQKRLLRHPSYPSGWVRIQGLANGLSGVGLTLIHVLADADPSWDRLFCLSLREPQPSPEGSRHQSSGDAAAKNLRSHRSSEA
jgi:hypothetical protein